MYKYFPHTEDEIQEMLKTIGVNSLEELYAEIPEELKVKHELNITPAKSEMEVRKELQDLAEANFIKCLTSLFRRDVDIHT